MTIGRSRAAAPVLVGADGANGVVARTFGLGGGIEYGIALEGNGPLAAGQRGLATVEVGVVPGGYGWVFPKSDHANYGVGGWSSEGPRVREHLRRLCAAHGVDSAKLTDLRGTRLPMRRSGRASAGPVLLVGDAAGLVDPLTGDGIFEALVSARLASEAILAGEHHLYKERLAAAVGRRTASSWKAKRVLDRHPRLTYEVARLPFVWGAVSGVLAGEIESSRDVHGLARPPLRLLARL